LPQNYLRDLLRRFANQKPMHDLVQPQLAGAPLPADSYSNGTYASLSSLSTATTIERSRLASAWKICIRTHKKSAMVSRYHALVAGNREAPRFGVRQFPVM
jgi:hypothetical protein